MLNRMMLMVMLVLMFDGGKSLTDKCLADIPEIHPKRYFYFGEQTLDIRIEVSSRISHQLASQVLKILLEEVIGYANVSLINREDFMNATLVLHRLSGCRNRSHCKHHPLDKEPILPETMVNLEVWTGPGFNMEDWLTTGSVEDCGPLGPIGRFGWYIPKYMTSSDWRQCDVLDHWRSLRDENVVQKFDLSNEMNTLKSLTIKSLGRYYCDHRDCREGVFQPKICQGINATCATLLCNYPGMTLSMVRQQIEELDLRVRVIWIGPHLTEFVRKRFLQFKPVLFFNWKPSPITASNNYTHIAFPMCEDSPNTSPFTTNCQFEINQLEKLAWSQLKATAPEALHVIRNMVFTHVQYTSLLNSSMDREPSTTLTMVACEWLRNNKHIWQTWMPHDLSTKTTIFIAGIFPMTGINYSSRGIIPGEVQVQGSSDKSL